MVMMMMKMMMMIIIIIIILAKSKFRPTTFYEGTEEEHRFISTFILTSVLEYVVV
jgi:hypothetical protein